MIRVLMVEDYQLIRRGIKANLEKEEDIKIIAEVETTEDAIEKSLELKPDVILMDIKLGNDENGGITATLKIKEQLKDTMVMILSFYDDEEHIARAIDARVDGYLLKDIDQEELVKAIRTVYSGKSVIHPAIASKIMKQLADKSSTEKRKREIQNSLSSREMEVYKLLTHGMSNKEISSKLFITEATVKAHISSILRKLDVTDRTQAVIIALNLEIFK